jgi:hypothetical protein
VPYGKIVTTRLKVEFSLTVLVLFLNHKYFYQVVFGINVYSDWVLHGIPDIFGKRDIV